MSLTDGNKNRAGHGDVRRSGPASSGLCYILLIARYRRIGDENNTPKTRITTTAMTMMSHKGMATPLANNVEQLAGHRCRGAASTTTILGGSLQLADLLSPGAARLSTKALFSPFLLLV